MDGPGVVSDFPNRSKQNQDVENFHCKTEFSKDLDFDQKRCTGSSSRNRGIDDGINENSDKLKGSDPLIFSETTIRDNWTNSNAMANVTNMESKDVQIERVELHSLSNEMNSATETNTDQSTCKSDLETSVNGKNTHCEKLEEVSKKCEVCCSTTAKYKCPRCEIQTCSVPCVKQHKVSSGCTGERDKLEFVDISQYSDKDLLNDYRFLEDAERRLFSNSSAPSSHRRQGARFAPYHLGKRCKFLMNAAYKRGISLSFVSPALSKNKANTSFYTISTDTIEWHVDWLFSSTNTLVKDEKVSESTVLINAVRKFTNFTEYPHLRKSLEDYRGTRLDSSQLLLKLEGLPANRTRYFALKPNETVAENLKGMCLIEYPTIVVVPSSDPHAQDNYAHLSKEDMVEMDRSSARHMLQFHPQLNPTNDVERELLNINSSLYSGSQEIKDEQLET